MKWITWTPLWAGLLAGTLLTGCSTLRVVSWLPKLTESPVTKGYPPRRHVRLEWPTLRYGPAHPAKESHAVAYCAKATATDHRLPAETTSSLHYFCPTAQRAGSSVTDRHIGTTR